MRSDRELKLSVRSLTDHIDYRAAHEEALEIVAQGKVHTHKGWVRVRVQVKVWVEGLGFRGSLVTDVINTHPPFPNHKA